jgi:MFS family permease
MWLTATAPLAPSLLPRSKFATYASALGICAAVAGMVMGPIVGSIMDMLNPGRKIDHYDFHYMYLWSSIFITLSLLASIVVFQKFMKYGGPKHYVAPE